MEGLQLAIKTAGSQKKLAEQLKVSQQYISNCVQRGYFPIARAIEIEEKLGINRLKLIDQRIVKAIAAESQ